MRTKGISDQAQLLHSALLQRGIEAEIEKFDGHKHIDIAIAAAKLNIEVDGIHHFTNANSIIADLRREYFSEEKDYDTIHIPNQAIDTRLNEVTDAIVEVIQRRLEGNLHSFDEHHVG